MRNVKDSGIEWVGNIPDHWNVMPNKRVMHKQKEICNKYNGEPILSLTMNGVIIRDLDAGGKIPTTFDGYQIVKPNNLLMCLFDYDVTPRCIGLIKNFGITSPAYSQFVLDNGNCPNYYYYYYLMIDNTKEILHLAKNLRHSFTEEQLGEIYTPVPPIEEQRKIANFLNEKIGKIDNAIEKTKETIEDYKKLKQSIIYNAVTKGIDEKVELKESGYSWLGLIPKKWKISKIKKVANLKTGSTPSTAESKWFNGDFNWFTPGDFSDLFVLKSSNRKLSIKAKRDNVATIIPGNSVLIIGIGGTAGKIGFVEEECSCNQQITALLPKSVFPKYLMYWMIANTKYLKDTALYTTLPIINNDFLGNYLFVDPGNLDLEKQIVEFLDNKCSAIDRLIKSKEKIVEELEQYKKSVIYEYVTGKKEVK